MGACQSIADPESLELHAAAEAILKEAKRKRDGEARILLLGSGDSGKTTIIKQMRLITNAKWTRAELESYRQLVFSNVIRGMIRLIETLEEHRLVDLQNDDQGWSALQLIKKAQDLKEGQPFPREYLAPLQLLWSNRRIQRGRLHSTRSPHPDNLSYFFSALPRLFEPKYRPSTQDILQVRTRTSGIVEYLFDVSDIDSSRTSISMPVSPYLSNTTLPSSPDARSSEGSHMARMQTLAPSSVAVHDGSSIMTTTEEGKTSGSASMPPTLKARKSRTAIGKAAANLLSIKPAGSKNLHMIDVGGQRSERRKWIHCFEDVTAILFMVSLNGYDQCLFEASDQNQMIDAMVIWDGICSLKYFQYTNIILLLNKEDLFDEKVSVSPIKNFFPDFTGPEKDAQSGKDYFKKRFEAIQKKGMKNSKTGKSNNPNAFVPSAGSHVESRTSSATAAVGGNAAGGQSLGQIARTGGEHQGLPLPRNLYTHFTTATNTSMVAQVMITVADIVLRNNFNEINLI